MSPEPKRLWVLAIEHYECPCGVWRAADVPLCWNHEKRSQLTSEALAQLNQTVRNLGYEVARALRLRK